jgi:hypothetical protein
MGFHSLFYAATSIAVALTGLTGTAHADCCENEFDWAAPYAEAARNHGLSDVLSDLGIQAALAMEAGCGLTNAIGAEATVRRLEQDYDLPAVTAGRLLVAAADVCPEIQPALG